MDKPRIFLGSSGKQAKLLQALTRGLEDVAHVEPWTASFNPGTTTLERLLELTREVDFAAFVFARDDWTTNSPPASDPSGSGQASPRDNVVFEAGLFGAALGMRRTFILHASGAKLPSDLLGLTCVRYSEADHRAEMRVINQKLRKAIENEGRAARIEACGGSSPDGAQRRGAFGREPLADLARPRRGAGGGGPRWQEDGDLSARYWSEAAKERKDPPASSTTGRENGPAPERAAVGRDGRNPDSSPPIARPGTSQLVRTLTRKSTRGRPVSTARRSRGSEHPGRRDDRQRAELIAERLTDWKSRRTNA
jgi:hypothetical protein